MNDYTGYAEKPKKQWGKTKSMLFWLITTLMLFVLLRLGGMETIFG